MVDLSIIIISYNTSAITKKCLDTIFNSLKKADFITQIIVLDNNSTDGSIEMLNRYTSPNFAKASKEQAQKIKLKIIESKKNLGFAKGNNEAVKQSNGKHILLLNSDIEVIDDAIPKLYQFFTSQNKFTFVGGKLLNKDGTDQASSAPFYTIPIIIGALFLKGDYFHITRYSPQKISTVDWVSGACIMTTREAYDKIGGFDENIFMYMDEVDLLFRAKKIGLLTGFYPESRFIHLGSASSQGKTQPILQVYRGFLYFYKKHHNLLSIIILKNLLQLKAMIAFVIGKATKNRYLIDTYEQALDIVKKS